MAAAKEKSRTHVGKKHSFDAAFKLKVTACTEKSTNRGATAEFFVDKKSV